MSERRETHAIFLSAWPAISQHKALFTVCTVNGLGKRLLESKWGGGGAVGRRDVGELTLGPGWKTNQQWGHLATLEPVFSNVVPRVSPC